MPDASSLRAAPVADLGEHSPGREMLVDESLVGIGRVRTRVARRGDGLWSVGTSLGRPFGLPMEAPTLFGALVGASVGWWLGLRGLLRRSPSARQRRASRRLALVRGWSRGSIDAALARSLAPWRVAGSPGRGDVAGLADDTAWPWWRDDEVSASGAVDAPRPDGPGRFCCRALLPGLGEYRLVAGDPLVAVLAALDALRVLRYRPFSLRFPLQPDWDYRAFARRSASPPPLAVHGHLPTGEPARIEGAPFGRGEWRYQLFVGDAPPVAAQGVTALGAMVNLVPAWRSPR